jgi:type III restriction enzyme
MGGGRIATEAEVERARTAWANEFLDKCSEKGLEVVAITDHHEMVMVRYVEQAAATRKAANPAFDIWIFPGMELTAADGVQCLIVFDANLAEEWRRQAQGKLGIIYPDEKTAQAPKVTQLAIRYPDIGGALDELGEGIKGKFIVLPNVSQGGQHTVLIDGHHADFKRMPYVGGYVDRDQSINTLGPKNLRRLSGNDQMWGTRFIYPLPTSDSRSSDFVNLGQNDCWIKLAAPTAEAIRQAFLGYQSRISITRPTIASLAIVSARLRGSTIIRDTHITFSAELNATIGGRGSGKSSFLEYLAFGLGRSCHDLAKEAYSGSGRMASLIKDTLITPRGSIELVVRQDNADFTIVRSAANAYQPQITYPNGSAQAISTKELRSLFPAVVYNQGELSELGKQAGRRAQLTDLLQFVNPDFKRQDDQLASEIDGAKLKIRTAIQDLSENWRKQSEIKKLTTAKESLEQRVAALQKTLPQLSQGDQAIVDRFKSLSAFEAERAHASNQIDVALATITDLATQPFSVDLRSGLPEAASFIAAHTDFVEKYRAGAAAIAETLHQKKQVLEQSTREWQAVLVDARSARDAVLEKLGEHRNVTAQIVALQQEIADTAIQIGGITLNLKPSEEHSAAVTKAVDALKTAVTARASRTADWARQIEELSSAKIKAELNEAGDISEIRDAVDTVAAKTGSQEAPRHRQVTEAIQAGDAWTYLDELRSDCLSALYWKQFGAGLGESKPNCAALYRTVGGTERTQTSAMELMDLSRVEAIATATPKADISLFYHDQNRDISFDKASEGQRAAALLFMLLEQPGGPLLVDQPEGDLDNKIISELTDKMHLSKQRRQIFFASHNANIVVNGSAELVTHLDVHEEGKRHFQCAGAIDNVDICRTITATMEGGEKAFRDRQSKYGY